MSRRGLWGLFIPAMAFFCLFVLTPTLMTFVDSVWVPHEGTRVFRGMELYGTALADPKFHMSLMNNLVYLGWTILFEVVVGLVLALALEREGRLNTLLRIAFFAPSVLSLVVIGLVFGFLFKDGVGLLPGLLSGEHAMLTLSVISGWTYCGFFMVIFLGGLASIPAELQEAARMDGANDWQLFWRIKLPLLREVLLVALLICFTGAFKAFDFFWVLVPFQESTAIISTQLVKEFIQFDNAGYGSTLAVLLTVIVLGSAGAVSLLRRILAGRTGPSSRGT